MWVEPGIGPTPGRTWFTEKEAARQAGVSPRTIRRWHESGELRVRKIGGQNHYRWAELAEIEAARRARRTRPYG